jgi:hypothetical protein
MVTRQRRSRAALSLVGEGRRHADVEHDEVRLVAGDGGQQVARVALIVPAVMLLMGRLELVATARARAAAAGRAVCASRAAPSEAS